jgi:hypothetical protein
LLVAGPALAQESNARVSGIVTDPSKAVITAANVVAVNIDTNARFPAKTNGSGIYVLPGLPVGDYRIEVEHTGFKSIVEPGIVLHTQDALELNFEMALGSASETVTVNAFTTNDSPAVSMTVDREFIENMPLNGRSFQDLIQLAPGTVDAGFGYYSVDGQRSDSNNYTVDGVSANLGGFINGGIGLSSISGSAPAQTMLDTTQSLASVDSLQEFTIQTSGYTAEYGRNPGGQVQFTTRSGANDIHGSLFEYLRNTAFDANSFANDFYKDPQTAEHQNDFGGTLGGPVRVPKLYDGRNKSFYFFSYEGLRLLLPAFESRYVPTQAFRSWASPNVEPFLNASPVPSQNTPGNNDGCTITDPSTGQPAACDAHLYYGYSYPNSLDNISLRVDQNLSKRLHGFVRYADTPSSSVRGAEQVETVAINTHTWTAGLTANITSNLLDEFRFNYSRDGEEAVDSLRSIDGSTPWARDLLIPAEFENPYDYAYVSISIPGSRLNTTYDFSGENTTQHQNQIVDSLAWTRGKHSLKVGGDWRRLTPISTSTPYSFNAHINSRTAIQQGYATTLFISASAPGQPVLDNLSLYAQDQWKIGTKLSIDYGLRWEFNPPPNASNGHYPVILTSSDLATAQLAPLGTLPFKTDYHSFAPRFGFAWNAVPSQRHPLTIRGGFGIFFDTGQEAVANAYTGGYPFQATAPEETNVPFPLSAAVEAPPSLTFPLTPPYPSLNVWDPSLTLPYTEQWNLSFDEMLNAKNKLTVSYVGNNGRKLLFTQLYDSVPANPNFSQLFYTYNGSQSSYNALQVLDTGHIANGLDLVGSFTWAHALDNASNDESYESPQYGNSDNDIRRSLNLALNYQIPAAGGGHLIQAVTHGWLLANRFYAQSGYPLSIVEDYVELPNGPDAQYAPDLVPGVAIYLHGSAANGGGHSVPGNWSLNPAAFALVPIDPNSGNPIRQGTLGRNFVRNPSSWALNTAVQRSFPIYEGLHVNFGAEAFNIFNHPSLNDPDTYLPDSTFGELIEGSVTTIGSGNSLYAMGGSRSLQFSLRFQF